MAAAGEVSTASAAGVVSTAPAAVTAAPMAIRESRPAGERGCRQGHEDPETALAG